MEKSSFIKAFYYIDSLKVTNKHQFEMLISLMKQHPNLAIGIGNLGIKKQRIAKKLWEEFSIKLNSIGPPHRTMPEWQRVWIHFKGNLKRRLLTNKKNVKAAGRSTSGEVALPPLFQSVISIIKLKEAACTTARALGQPTGTNIFENYQQNMPLNSSTIISTATAPENTSTSGRKLRTRKSHMESKILEANVERTDKQSKTNAISNFKVSRSSSSSRQSSRTKTMDVDSKLEELIARQFVKKSKSDNALETSETSSPSVGTIPVPIASPTNVEYQILDAIAHQTEGQSDIINFLKSIETISQNNYEINRKMLSIMEKQYADSKELHDLNVQLTKEKIKMLGVQNKSNDS